MKIISWNVNGIRAAYKRNFTEWVEKSKADIVGIQEVKAQIGQLPWDLTSIRKYHFYLNSAEKKGYSGTAIYTKTKPNKVSFEIGFDRFDSEGRMVKLDFDDFSVLNLYIPNGGRTKENLDYKLKFYEYFIKYLKKQSKNLILMGDFNIAHKKIDLARPKQNEKNIMFTPEEREIFGDLINSGFVDTFRMFEKEGGYYSWWAYFRNLRERNIGWRIDYILASKKISKKVKGAFILRDVMGSDHCPVGIEFNVK